MKRLFYFLLALLPALIAAVLLFLGSAKIDTAMSSLLPQNGANQAVLQAVEDQHNRRLNETAVVLVGSSNAQQAFENAKEIAKLWRQSGLFNEVVDEISLQADDFIKINQELNLALLPENQAQILLNNPDDYFQERAEDLLNPFSGNLISVSDDVLGFSRFISLKQGLNQLEWSSQYNALYSEYQNKTWVWVRANPNKKAITHIPHLLQETQNFANNQGVEVLMSGGIFFAADSKQKAEYESKIMSAVGLTLTFAFLLWAFRTPRILALSVVLIAGISTGLAVSLAVFSTVHILTLVVGTSLVGVLVDFPLHGLSASLFRQPENKWLAQNAIRKLLPTFAISLCITATGYLLLLFAPLALLKQTAVFSVAALCGAFLATVFLLPEFLRHYQPRTTHFTQFAHLLSNNINRLPFIWISLICGVFLAFGVTKTQWQDDIRQWVVLPDDLLQQTVKVAQISGIEQNAQSVIIQADSEDNLLNLSKNIANKIQPFANTQSLHEWILPSATQQKIKQHLHNLAQQNQSFEAMTAVGISPEMVRQAMIDTAQKPDITLSGSLNSPLAEAWRHLYVGKIGNQHIALMNLSNIRNVSSIENIIKSTPCNENSCVQFIDKRQELNQQFAHIRNLTAYLKIASFVLAFVVLWAVFGKRKSLVIITPPTLAVLATIGVLGWLQTPVGLFAMFGLLLSSAVGIDYTVYAVNAPEQTAVKTAGITLSAATTGISFALLSFSQTPAVATFGLSVAIAVAFNWIITVWLISGCLKE